jgi:hypothetical protein
MYEKTTAEWQDLVSAEKIRARDMETRWRDEQRTSADLRETIKIMKAQMKDLEGTLFDKTLLVELLKEKCGVK